MIIIRAVIVAIVSFTILSAGYDWGLPSNERASVLFSDNNEHNNMVDLLAKNYRLQKEKTGNKIKSENKNKNKVSVKIIPERITIFKFSAEIKPAAKNTPGIIDFAIKPITTQVKLSIRI